jgi:signal transduction histidine kinase
MSSNEWIQPPRRLLVVFLSIAVVLAGAFGWLGWQLIRQERVLASQRDQERTETAADLVVAGLQKDLSELEQHLTILASMSAGALAQSAAQFAAALPGESVLLLLHAAEIEPVPPGRLLFYPIVPPAREPPSSLFEEVDGLEFLRRDYGSAIAALNRLSRSSDALIRAEAFLRLGRIYRKIGRREDAFEALDELRRLGPLQVSGLPAELIACDALCSMLEDAGHDVRLEREAAALYADLAQGRWKLSAAAYTFYVGQAQRRAGASAAADPARQDAQALSEATETLWDEWQRSRQEGVIGGGRRSRQLAGRPVLLVWRSSQERAVALAASTRDANSVWLQALRPVLAGYGAEVTLLDGDGRPAFGTTPPAGARASVRLASATRLPWTIQVWPATNTPVAGNLLVRRRLLVTGLCLMALIVAAGTYFMGRAVARELRVARQQSDFVAAVSHEFRTPLTSLCQFIELLAKGRVGSETDRQRFYDVLARESQRLRRLVESLLNFGRLEAGVLNYRFEPLDAAELAGRVVAEFQDEAAGDRHLIELSAEDRLPPIRADREALSCVIWNLLDNAVKYSPESRRIWIDLARAGNHVSMAVRDQGLGIAPSEQSQVFKKFIRGKASEMLNIRGTGIGLAIARQIIHDHAGEITVDSESGKGSTFTVFLPIVE